MCWSVLEFFVEKDIMQQDVGIVNDVAFETECSTISASNFVGTLQRFDFQLENILTLLLLLLPVGVLRDAASQSTTR